MQRNTVQAVHEADAGKMGTGAGVIVRARFGQRFTIQDGVTFIGIIPLAAATDLGRDVEVTLSDKGELTPMQGGGRLKTSMVLNLYDYRANTPFDGNRPDLDEAWGRFALEISDATQFADFAALKASHRRRHAVEARASFRRY